MDVSLWGASARPLRLTRFFGRETAGDELARILTERRLVTLVGAPGCGKTRLALEVGASLVDRRSARVCVVEFASIGDPSLVAPTVATALGLADEPNRSVEDTIVDGLPADELLLVLDNCEHVVGAVSPLVARLLASCPSLRVLATSRTALALDDEQVWQVPPLELASAVELFGDRADLTSPGAIDADAHRETVERICLQLDRLPLAIELVAAWIRLLTPVEMLHRLDRALPLLRSQARDASQRQRTMEATVDWSYQLHTADEKLLFERLSVFAGSFDLDAAHAVAADDGVLEGLTSLVGDSLVQAEPDSGGATRYRLLEPVRQCAQARLDARGEGEATRRRHAEHYLDVALRFDAELRSKDPGAVLAQWNDEEGNFRRALERARGNRADLALRLCTALASGWAIRGRVSEGRAWLDEMLRLPVDSGDRQLRASALARASRLAWRQLDYGSARSLLEESIVIACAAGDSLGLPRRMRSLALVAMAQGDFDEAERLGTESVALFRRNDDPYGLSLALAFLGMTLHLAGRHDHAVPYVEEALVLNRMGGNVTGAIYSLGAMAFGAIAAGDLGELRAHTKEILELLRTLEGNHEDPGWLWWTAVALAAGESRYRTALRLAGAADASVRSNGLQLHEQLRRQVLPWLERARAHVGSVEAQQLMIEGSQLGLEQLLEEAVSETDGGQHSLLSRREFEIVDLIAQGLTNAEIAQHLVISRRTVETHVVHIKAKLGVTRRARIVAWALAHLHRADTSS